MEKQLKSLIENLNESFSRWEHLYKNGGSDPLYTDGVNMRLVRNHIFSYKRQIKELCEQNGLELPEEYYRDEPPEVDMSYMAKPEEIRKKAKVSLQTYKLNENYKSLCLKIGGLNEKQKEKTCIKNVIGYVRWLEKAIVEDDLVTMRRHGDCRRYQEAFESCLRSVREIESKLNEAIDQFGEQLSWF